MWGRFLVAAPYTVSVTKYIGVCFAVFLLTQSAFSQSLPKYSDINRHALQLRSEVMDARSKVFKAITSGDYPVLLGQCGQLKYLEDKFMKDFYSNESYNYFALNGPKSFKEQYIASALINLADAMTNRTEAVYIICRTPAMDRHTLMSGLSLLANAYTATQSTEMWLEMSDMQK